MLRSFSRCLTDRQESSSSRGGNPITARKWLLLAAKAMDIPLGIRRRGRTLYFWVESPLLQEHTTGAQQRRSNQAQPFIIDEEQEVTDKTLEEEQPA
jgi:hypothetical protein